MAIASMFMSKLANVGQILVDLLIPPPPPRICGSNGGPPVTAKRVQLKDGRHLAYKEHGVNKADAKYKIVFCHGFTGSRRDNLNASQELMEELGVYIVGFDRAGYGESDPKPDRSVRSTALDIAELADALELGSKFYLVSQSIGGHAGWGAIKYIPERIAAAVLIAPVVNYRWPKFPRELSRKIYRKQELGDQWTLRVSYYAPSILHWWLEQSWLPTSTVLKGTTPKPNKQEAELSQQRLKDGSFSKRVNQATQQGRYESIYRELKVMFGKWEFDPMDLTEPPFPVHLFQGSDDSLVAVPLQRYLAKQLTWLNYHELPGVGHRVTSTGGLGNEVLKTLIGKSSN